MLGHGQFAAIFDISDVKAALKSMATKADVADLKADMLNPHDVAMFQ